MSSVLDQLRKKYSKPNQDKMRSKGGDEWIFHDIKALPDGISRLRIVPDPTLNRARTFQIRLQHPNIVPRTAEELAAKPDANPKPAMCSALVDPKEDRVIWLDGEDPESGRVERRSYCQIDHLIDLLLEAGKENPILHNLGLSMLAYETVKFTAKIMPRGMDEEVDPKVYIFSSDRKAIIDTFALYVRDDEFDEVIHPQKGKLLIIDKKSKLTTDGKNRVEFSMSWGQKSIPLDEEDWKRRPDIGKMRPKKLEELRPLLTRIAPEFVDKLRWA